jgi:ubiquinol-cytochrome c reductase cytochrome b subunit
VKSGQDTVPFHPYYTMKDAFAIMVFLIVLAVFVFFSPNYLGHAINYDMADPLKTPPHIVPEWYFLPFYAILRSITFDIGPLTAKLLGVIAMFASLLVLFVLPWLDTSRVRSATYRPIYRQVFWLLVLDVILLGYLGSKPAEGIYVTLAFLATLYYFAHFLVIMPLLGLLETPRPLPSSISDSVLAKKSAAAPAE